MHDGASLRVTEWAAALLIVGLPFVPLKAADIDSSLSKTVVGAADGLFPYRFECGDLRIADVVTLTDGSRYVGKAMEWADQVLLFRGDGTARAWPVTQVRGIEFRRTARQSAPPPLPDLTVAYVERLPRDPGWHGRVEIRNGLPHLNVDPEGQKWRPADGDEVRFRIHVRNAGFKPSSPAPCLVLMDDALIAEKAVPAIEPGEESVVEASWRWRTEAKTLRVRLALEGSKPESLTPEIARWNNDFSEPVQGLAVAVVVARNRYEAFRRQRSLVDSANFEDWAQFQLSSLNALFRASVYPSSPDGIRERVRCDRILIVDDPFDAEQFAAWSAQLKQDAADGLAEYAAVMVFGRLPEPADLSYDALKMDWSALQEVARQLGLADLSATDTRLDQCMALDGRGYYVQRRHVFPRQNLMMYRAGGFRFSAPEAAYLNRIVGQPRGFGGDYLYQLPRRVTLLVRSNSGRPLENVRVDAYQLHSRGALAGTIAGVGRGDPLYSAPTDSNGRLSLLDQEAPRFTSPHGYELGPNPFGTIETDGSNGLLLLKLQYGEAEEYRFMRLYDCSEAFLRGDQDEYVVEIDTRFGDPDAPPAPVSTAINMPVRDSQQPDMIASWRAPPGLRARLVDEYRLYKRISFGGEETRPWRLAAINRRGTTDNDLALPGTYFDPIDSFAGYGLDTFFAVSVVDRSGRESALSGPGYIAWGKTAGKFALQGDAGIITLSGDGPGQILRWDGKLATQPFGVRNHRFAGYQPHFGGVAFAFDRRLIVTDPVNHVLAFYDERGDLDDVWPRRTWWPGFPSDDEGEFNVPLDVAVDQRGLIYVADFGNQRVQILDSGRNARGLLDPEFHFEGPQAVAFSNGHLCVTDRGAARVRVYDVTDDQPRFVREINGLYDADRALVSRTGKVYVTGRMTPALEIGILVFSPDGNSAVFDRMESEVEMGKVYSPRGLYFFVNALDQDYGYCVNEFPFDVRRIFLE